MIIIEYKNCIIEVEKHVIEIIEKNRQIKPYDKESGGMVIGSMLSNSNDIIIRDYTVPLIGDYQSRYRFIRKKRSHNTALQRKWEKSNGTVMYMGEWHTHPETDPHYSSQDIRNWEKLLVSANTFCNYLFFIIGGLNYYKIWIGSRKTQEIFLIHKGGYDEGS